MNLTRPGHKLPGWPKSRGDLTREELPVSNPAPGLFLSAQPHIENLGGTMPLKALPTGETDKFDALTVNAVLTGIVADAPEGFRYVDPNGREAGSGASCVYSTRDGKPSCLVGVLMHRLGVPRPAWVGQYGGADNGNNFRHLSAAAQFFTPEAIDRLDRVQQRQDAGQTWARAIR